MHATFSVPLAQSHLFQPLPQNSTQSDQIIASYRRARAFGRHHGLSPEDVAFNSDKFWALHRDFIGSLDTAARTLMTIQYNLAAGTLAPFALKRPELMPALQSILNFDVSAQYLLTELGHGLDAPNLETTATLLDNGEFDLHTPNPRAAKYMPPTGLVHGFPRVAIVIARLMVSGEDRGVRPFLVALGNGEEMCAGITAKVLPARGGPRYVDHALTYFNHVRLPAEALLGDISKPDNLRDNFQRVIWRVAVGSMAISTFVVADLYVAAYIAGKYSIRRKVNGNQPIIAFRTQQLPILHALAAAFVLDSYANRGVHMFLEHSQDHRVQHGIAASLKAVMAHHSSLWLPQLGARCGAQGLFGINQIAVLEHDIRGAFIAEGDILALAIRLASELLIGRYDLPPSTNPGSLLAQYERGLFSECRDIMKSLGGAHRTDGFNRRILPMSLPLVTAIGHRMAYDAAIQAGVDTDILKLFEIGFVKHDASWFSENLGISRERQREMEDLAVTRLLPRLDELLDLTGAQPFTKAPIVAEEGMSEYIDELPTFRGNAELTLTDGKRYFSQLKDIFSKQAPSPTTKEAFVVLPNYLLSKL